MKYYYCVWDCFTTSTDYTMIYNSLLKIYIRHRIYVFTAITVLWGKKVKLIEMFLKIMIAIDLIMEQINKISKAKSCKGELVIKLLFFPLCQIIHS